MNSTRRNHRVVVTKRGGPEVLQLIEEDLPQPATSEVRVKVLAAGVSAYDLMARSFWFPGDPSPPFTPGEDVVGMVDALGHGVSTFAIGDRVAAWTFGDGGGYSEYTCIHADRLVRVPADLDPAEAVAVVVNYLTAHLHVHQTAEAHTGERVLIHGAAGGLGSALLQVGRLAGLEMYGTASGHNHDFVAGLGATPIDYRNEDFVARVMELTHDHGVDVVFDTVGGVRQLWRSYRCLSPRGRLVPMGSTATKQVGAKSIPLGLLTIGALKLIPDHKRIGLTPNMMKYPRSHMDWYRDTLTELLDLASCGKIEPTVRHHIPLAEAASAHDLIERSAHTGKVVLV